MKKYMCFVALLVGASVGLACSQSKSNTESNNSDNTSINVQGYSETTEAVNHKDLEIQSIKNMLDTGDYHKSFTTLEKIVHSNPSVLNDQELLDKSDRVWFNYMHGVISSTETANIENCAGIMFLDDIHKEYADMSGNKSYLSKWREIPVVKKMNADKKLFKKCSKKLSKIKGEYNKKMSADMQESKNTFLCTAMGIDNCISPDLSSIVTIFESNEVKAESLFGKRTIIPLNAKILKVRKGIMSQVIVELGVNGEKKRGFELPVQAYLKSTEASKAAGLKIGDMIRVKCFGAHKLVHLALRDCEFLTENSEMQLKYGMMLFFYEKTKEYMGVNYPFGYLSLLIKTTVGR